MNSTFDLWQQYSELLARQLTAIEAGDADELDLLMTGKEQLLEHLGRIDSLEPPDERLQALLSNAREMELASVAALDAALSATAQHIRTARRRRVESRAAAGGNVAGAPAPRYLNQVL